MSDLMKPVDTDFAFRWIMKGSFVTHEAAETARRGVKKDCPILQVMVYDGVESVNKSSSCGRS
jgi:hypothetical protein